jgi:hypothetical protein
VLADIPHEQHGFILGKEDGVANVSDWDWKFEAAFGPVPEISATEEYESDLLSVPYHVLDAHDQLLWQIWWRMPVPPPAASILQKSIAPCASPK